MKSSTMTRLLLTVLCCICTLAARPALAADIYGYWRSNKPAPFDIAWIDKNLCRFSTVQLKPVRISTRGNVTTIFFLSPKYALTASDKSRMARMSDKQLGRHVPKIVVERNKQGILVTTFRNKKVQYTPMPPAAGEAAFARLIDPGKATWGSGFMPDKPDAAKPGAKAGDKPGAKPGMDFGRPQKPPKAAPRAIVP